MGEKTQCQEDGCDKPVYCKGICRFHYDKQRRESPEGKAKHNQTEKASQDRLNADPEYRARKNAYRREFYRKQRARVAAELRERYANDPEYRAQVEAEVAARREQRKQRTIEQRARERIAKSERYANDPEYRERVKARVRNWRAANADTARKMDRKYREENKAKIRAHQSSPEYLARRRQHHAELKLEVLLAYGDGSCAECGYQPTDIFELELHHVHGDGAEHRRQLTKQTQHRNYTMQFYQALKETGWANDVPMITLCANCHKRETLRLQRERGSLPPVPALQ